MHGLDIFEERRCEREKRVRGLDWCEEYAHEVYVRLERTLKDVSLKEVEVIGMEKENSRPIALFGAAVLLNDDQIDDFICGVDEDFQPSSLKKKTMKFEHRQRRWERAGSVRLYAQ